MGFGIREILSSQNSQNISVIVSEFSQLNKANYEILNYYLNEKNMQGVYLTSSIGSDYLKERLQSQNIPIDKIFFMDLNSDHSKKRHLGFKDHSMHDVLVATNHGLNLLSPNHFIIIDSLGVIDNKTAKYIESISKKNGARSVIYSSSDKINSDVTIRLK